MVVGGSRRAVDAIDGCARIRSVWVVLLGAILVLAAPGPRAQAWEAFDGRLQLHGFYEMQLRTINKDFQEEWDLSQWYNILNLEVEADLLPDGLGFIERASMYARL